MTERSATASDMEEADVQGAEAISAPAVEPAEQPHLDATGPQTARALGEATWVSRAQDGDATAFKNLVDAYEGELFRLGYRILSDRGEAEDVVQDVLVIMWRQLPSLSDPQAFRSWIFQIATRRCLYVLRRRQAQRADVTPDGDVANAAPSHALPAPSYEGPADVAQAAAVRRGLDHGLAALPADQRASWVLHHLHDLTYAQIAYAIGAPVSTVRGRISRARQNLAKGMTEWQ